MKKTQNIFGRIFPNTTKAIAYYDPFYQAISFNNYSTSDFNKINIQAPSIKDIEVISVFMHEMTHWIDNLSTLWGQKNLTLLFNALNAKALNDENNYWHIKRYYDVCKADSFFDYYTETYVDDIGQDLRPWKYSLTSGLRFDHHGKINSKAPILFTKFFSKTNSQIGRIPFSVASILESNATYYEYRTKLNLISGIEDVFEKTRLLKSANKELNERLYSIDLMLYSINAHLYGNLKRTTDIYEAYKSASNIGTIVLNLPDTVSKKITLSKGNDITWNQRERDLLEINDKGFLYYTLTKNVIEKLPDKKHYILEDYLSSSGLPQENELKEKVLGEMEKNKKRMLKGPFYDIGQEVLEKGISFFDERGLDGENEQFLINLQEKEEYPFIMCNDTDFEILEAEPIMETLQQEKKLNQIEKYSILSVYERKLEEFVLGCGIY